MMARVRCEVSEGLRPQEATVMLTDIHGREEFLPIDRGMLAQDGDTYYLPIPVVRIDLKNKTALISLPQASDSGAHQLLVSLDQMRNIPAEVLE